ncbi:predicted protein [Plenodomus lingam JN3]|uniref:Predicted protein n=1 Tax=Leptosphaeria maculans (strain JN3 / isolate v23.1.3 / race Av1-4-5-6-7-8) TaxID=985895 RepID=E5AAQ7_LEPMJ|nr:predicted protein [Plenodomus lingam JN3]CBY00748.1 predicted protein [Plenodomus lingam JN3]
MHEVNGGSAQCTFSLCHDIVLHQLLVYTKRKFRVSKKKGAHDSSNSSGPLSNINYSPKKRLSPLLLQHFLPFPLPLLLASVPLIRQQQLQHRIHHPSTQSPILQRPHLIQHRLRIIHAVPNIPLLIEGEAAGVNNVPDTGIWVEDVEARVRGELDGEGVVAGDGGAEGDEGAGGVGGCGVGYGFGDGTFGVRGRGEASDGWRGWVVVVVGSRVVGVVSRMASRILSGGFWKP